MDINVFQVDAFTRDVFSGNPAGVVPCAKDLDEKDKKLIAKEMSLSETVFIDILDDCLFRTKFYTPKEEVDICGHATIGAFYMMAEKGYIRPIFEGVKKIEQITNIGRFPIYIHYKGGKVDKVYMEQDEPKSFGLIEDLEIISEALGISPSDIGHKNVNLKPEIIYTGLKDIIVPIKDEEVLNKIEIKEELVEKVSKELGVKGFHLFYMKDIDEPVVETRNFAPIIGIKEESATGTSNGALAYYLYKEGLLKDGKLLSNQGRKMDRLSKIYCEITDEGKVLVGGEARLVLDGIMKI